MTVSSFDGYRRNDDYLRDVARGGVAGAETFGALGSVTTAGAGAGVLWPNGSFVFPASAGIQMSVVSTSANDTLAGTGIRRIHLHYLDNILEEFTEIVTLNGLTPVLTSATNIRFVQGVHMHEFGSGAAAAGNITVSNSGQTYGEIKQGSIRCTSSVRMVPAGKRLMVTSTYAGSVSGTAAARTIVNIATPFFGGHDYTAANVFFPLGSGTFQDGSGGMTLPCPFPFADGQSVGMTYETDKAATIVGAWFGWMENA